MIHGPRQQARAWVAAGLRATHAQWLAASCFTLLLASCLEVSPDQQHIAVRGFPQYPLPHVCSARIWLGVKCPACGLTRSVIRLSHGDWRASLRAHRFGWVVAALVAAQIPYRGLALGRPNSSPFLGANTSWGIAIAVSVLLIASWLFDLVLRPASLMTGERTWPRLR